MYRSLYKLTHKPFHTSSDPRFLWLGEKHKEALATLKYGILDNKGFLLLTGDVGTGKTTLINTLVNSFGEDVIVATVLDPGLSRLDFFNYIANAFRMEESFESKGRFLVQFSEFLHKSHEAGKKILLIIDESQRLNNELLEEIRLLSNIEKQNSKLLNIFFVGQNEFNDMLLKPENRAVRQRLTLNYNLDPLSRAETETYINHRLKIAGTEEKIFTSEAIDEIFSYTLGFPRQINITCDLALLSGYVNENVVIGADVIRECAGDLTISEKSPDNPSSEPVLVPQKMESEGRGVHVLAPGRQSHLESPKDTFIQGTAGHRSSGIKKTSVFFLLLGLVFLGAFAAFPQLKKSTEVFVSSYLATIVSESGEKTVAKDKDEGKNITSISPFSVKSSAPDSEKKILDEPGEPEQEKIQQLSIVQATQINRPTTEQENIVENGDIEIGEMKIDNSEIEGEKIAELDDISLQRQDISNDILVDLKTKNKNEDGINKTVVPVVSKQTVPIPNETVLIWFPVNSNDISDKQMSSLSGFTEVLIQDKSSKIIITGYSDSVGTLSYNMKISEFRANIVKSYFLGSGVSPTQIKARGVGVENPVASNDTIEGRQANRRVEVVFDRPSSP